MSLDHPIVQPSHFEPLIGSSLTEDDCLRYLSEKTYRLTSKEYCASHPEWPGAVGLELETWPVLSRGGQAIPEPVPLLRHSFTGANAGSTPMPLTSEDILIEACNRYSWAIQRNDDGIMTSVAVGENDFITFEPGGQIEFSSRPYACLGDSCARIAEVTALLDSAFSAAGTSLVSLGANPWHTVERIGLQMNKPRYRAMDAYFGANGTRGRRMMRQTCTVQVNLDFGRTESLLVRRFVAAQLLAPIAAATFACSPFLDGADTGMVGSRQHIWHDTDPMRTGIIGSPAALLADGRRELCISAFWEFVRRAPVVFVASTGYRVPNPPVSFAEWLKHGIDGVWPTVSDFETHLSLLFPEVRPRGFLELRSVDCLPRPWRFVPACWYTGLLYDDTALDRVIEMLLPYSDDLPRLLRASVHGLADPTLATLAARVFSLADAGLGRLPSCYPRAELVQSTRAFQETFTARGRTPGDTLRDRVRARGEFYGSILADLDLEWSKALG